MPAYRLAALWDRSPLWWLDSWHPKPQPTRTRTTQKIN